MARYRHKQRHNLAGEPLVGGQPAHRILQIVRRFPLSVSYAGGVNIEIDVVGADKEMFERAYAWIELELLADEAKCDHAHAHATLDVAQYQYMILNELVYWARFALDDFPHDALWAPRKHTRLFGESVGAITELRPQSERG
jgi:hypothetical protein